MNKTVKWVIVTLACVLIFVAVYFLYGLLKDRYNPNQFTDANQNQTQESSGGSVTVQHAPDFTVLDANGKEVKLSDYFGKPIVLNFWATWCYYCKMEMPDFNDAYHNNPDVQFLMVNVTDGYQETMSSAKEYVEGEGYEFPVFYDTMLEAASTYGATGLPMSVFIGADGNVVAVASGMLSKEDLAKGIEMIQ